MRAILFEMLDFLLRAIKHPRDYCGIFKKHKLTFLAHTDEGGGVHSFTFLPDQRNLEWKAGQHGVFTFPNQKITGKSWRAFSIASSWHEGFIRITTSIPPEPSEFKQALLALQSGSVIHMHGPLGEFHASPTTSMIVGVAGGVGITPFKAIAHEIYNTYTTGVFLHLVYAGKADYFAFQSEFEQFDQHQNIMVHFVQTPDEVNQTLEKLVAEYGDTAEHFISGSPGMIGALRTKLAGLGIKKIINDPFKGY